MLPDVLVPLDTLAHNLWWAWQPDAVALFESIDPWRWARNHHNPVALLRDVEAAMSLFEQTVTEDLRRSNFHWFVRLKEMGLRPEAR